jgi:predicted nucleic acid-binding protein
VAADQLVVIDTNILFSALLAEDGRIHQTLFRSGRRFRICETVLVELFEHKERILQRTRLTTKEVVGMYHRVLRHLQVFPEELIPAETWGRAIDLCSGIDEDDAPHVELTLTLEGLLWTGDVKLRRGLEAKGFTAFFVPPAST